MQPFREDTLVYPTMVALKDCLCIELADSGLEPPCFCDLIPATSEGFLDIDCDCGDGGGGSAWVRLIQIFESAELPAPDLTGLPGTFLAAEFEVGVARCIESISDDGTAPSAIDQHMDTRKILADMAAMRRAVKCCFAETDEKDGRDYRMGAYTTMSGLGGVGGGSWQVFARVN